MFSAGLHASVTCNLFYVRGRGGILRNVLVMNELQPSAAGHHFLWKKMSTLFVILSEVASLPVSYFNPLFFPTLFTKHKMNYMDNFMLKIHADDGICISENLVTG